MSYRAYEDSLGVLDRFRFDDSSGTTVTSDLGYSFSGAGNGRIENVTFEQPGLVAADTENLCIDCTGQDPSDGDWGYCFISTNSTQNNAYKTSFNSVGVWITPTGSEDWDDDPPAGSANRPTILGYRSTDGTNYVGIGWWPNGNGATDAQFFAWSRISSTNRYAVTDNYDCVYGQTYHLVVTWTGTAGAYPKIYVNGTLVDTSSVSCPYASNANGRTTVMSGRIGGRNAPGVYDELTLFTNELSAAEIATLYTKATASGMVPPPLLIQGAC